MQFYSKIRLHPQRAFDLKATVIAGFMPPGHIVQKNLLPLPADALIDGVIKSGDGMVNAVSSPTGARRTQ